MQKLKIKNQREHAVYDIIRKNCNNGSKQCGGTNATPYIDSDITDTEFGI